MINDVQIKETARHEDERGFFCELIRQSDSFFSDAFAQLSHSMSDTGVLKAWHLHNEQTDWMYVVDGDILLALCDRRKDSDTFGEINEFFMGTGKDSQQCVIKIPPGVAHGYKILNGPCHMIYLMNKEYNPADEIRIPHDDPEINYGWKVDAH